MYYEQTCGDCVVCARERYIIIIYSVWGGHLVHINITCFTVFVTPQKWTLDLEFPMFLVATTYYRFMKKLRAAY